MLRVVSFSDTVGEEFSSVREYVRLVWEEMTATHQDVSEEVVFIKVGGLQRLLFLFSFQSHISSIK
jgi:hypothetical protein